MRTVPPTLLRVLPESGLVNPMACVANPNTICKEVRASGALDFDFSRARRAPRPSGLGLGFGFGLGLNVLSPIEYKHSVHVRACVRLTT